ncbi:23838_t:CDS:1, partial [Gigaspora margarita]
MSSISCVKVEDGISDDILGELKKLGHHARIVKSFKREMFGRSQTIEQKFIRK